MRQEIEDLGHRRLQDLEDLENVMESRRWHDIEDLESWRVGAVIVEAKSTEVHKTYQMKVQRAYLVRFKGGGYVGLIEPILAKGFILSWETMIPLISQAAQRQ